jgi:hypothetical protein
MVGWGWGRGSNAEVSVVLVQGPEFKPQYHKKLGVCVYLFLGHPRSCPLASILDPILGPISPPEGCSIHVLESAYYDSP